MRGHSRIHATLAAVAFCAVAFPGLACAAETAPELDVQIWPGGQAGQVVVIVGLTLPDTAELPATVQLPVVAGTSVSWAGEIVGADTSEDIQREVTLKQGTGGQYAEFELSSSRQAQVELSGLTLATSGSKVSTRVEFVQTTPAEKLTGFSVRLQSGVSDVEIDPAPVSEPDLNESGEALYTLPSSRLAEGASQSVSVSYSTGGAGDGSSGQALEPSALIALLAGLLVVACVALLLVVKRSRRPSR